MVFVVGPAQLLLSTQPFVHHHGDVCASIRCEDISMFSSKGARDDAGDVLKQRPMCDGHIDDDTYANSRKASKKAIVVTANKISTTASAVGNASLPSTLDTMGGAGETLQQDNVLYLAALRIFLLGEHGKSADKSPWLESTKNLSVVSLLTCEECRAAASFHVRVGNDTPRSLWVVPATSGNGKASSVMAPPGSSSSFFERAAPLSKALRGDRARYLPCGWKTAGMTALLESSGRNGPFSDDDSASDNVKKVLIANTSRVAAVKVAKITWDKTSLDNFMISEHTSRTTSCGRPSLSLICDANELVFGEAFNQSVAGNNIVCCWPRGLERLKFGSGFNQPIDQVAWPLGLKHVTFGKAFNQNVDEVAWPTTLETLSFGHGFAQSCAETVFPDRLRELTFGQEYNHPIDAVTWPSNIQRLKFGRKFNQQMAEVTWPRFLRVLTLGWHFDQSLNGSVLPQTLEVLSIVGVYDRPLDAVELPPGLKRLTLGGHFNQRLDAVAKWPEQLEELTFGWAFNRPLIRVSWPRHLRKLVLGYRFKQPADLVSWPEALEVLELGVFSRQSLAGLVWPQSLKMLSVSRAFDLAGVALPNSTKVCRRGHTYCKVQRGVKHWYNSITQ